jgi:hypothetical protein
LPIGSTKEVQQEVKNRSRQIEKLKELLNNPKLTSEQKDKVRNALRSADRLRKELINRLTEAGAWPPE